jgi:hypothetical protein
MFHINPFLNYVPKHFGIHFRGTNLSSQQRSGGTLQHKPNKWDDLPNGILLSVPLCTFPEQLSDRA